MAQNRTKTDKTGKTGKDEEMTFESAMERLEEIVDALDDGSSPLDKALDLFTEGVSLVKFCNKKLDEAEQKVRLLTEGKDGEIVPVPFTEEEQ